MLQARTSLALAAICSLISLASAQSSPPPYLELIDTGWAFGGEIEYLDDLDGDGVEDYLVAAHTFQVLSSAAGRVTAHSGVDGSVLYSVVGQPFSLFGSSLRAVGDVDGDGTADWVAGAPFETVNGMINVGAAYLHSGQTGAELLRWAGEDDFDYFGWSVTGTSDLDGDSLPDVAVGAIGMDGQSQYSGLVRIYSSANGGLIYALEGRDPDGSFGNAIASVGDLDEDGVDDLVVTDSGVAPGVVTAYSGSDGKQLHSFTNQSLIAGFGEDVEGLGDITGDGVPDYAVVSDTPVSLRIFSGADGSVVHKLSSYGWSVEPVGDWNADGVGDYALADFSAGATGEARIYSGADHVELERFSGPSVELNMGYGLAAGDLNADGKPDLLVGASSSLSGTGEFAVYGFLGGCELVASYCTAGTSASGCSATLSATGVASTSSASGFVVSATNVEGTKGGLFFFGSNGRQASPWQGGSSFQCIVPPVARGALLDGGGSSGAFDGSFTYDLNARWTAKPGQRPAAGALLGVQLWYRDSLGSGGTSLSDAIEVTVCP